MMNKSGLRKMIARLLLLATVLGTGIASAASDISPQELVRDTSSRMLNALREEQEAISRNPDRLFQLVADIILPYFDFRRMSQWVLGKNWRKATPDQRERFVVEFRRLLVRTYSLALAKFANEDVIFLPFDADSEARRVTVRTAIDYGGDSIPIYYSMFNSKQGWKIYDVSISGISLVTNYRSTFGNIIKDKGMDDLIEQLVLRNDAPADG